jgi:hypothetical protein
MVNDDNGFRRVTFLRTIDGDTFKCTMLLAPKIQPEPLLKISVRVEGWSAAELRQPLGAYFLQRFDQLLRAANVITVEMKEMSFNRVVGRVYLDDVLFSGILVTELLQVRELGIPQTREDI